VTGIVTVAELLFEHAAPLWLVVAVLIGVGALTIWSFWRYPPRHWALWLLAGLRVIFFLLLGWCLLLPQLKQELSERVRPRFLVAVDISGSMSLGPPNATVNRWQVARDILGSGWWRRLPGDPLVAVHPFAVEIGREMTPAEAARLTPNGPATHLRTALRKLTDRYRGQPVAGLLLLSDGLDTRETSEDWATEPWGCPVFAARLEPPGVWETEPDARVETVQAPRRVLLGWESKLTAVVAGQGLQGQRLTVQLLENDRVVQEQPLQLPAAGTREASFRVTHTAVGNYRYVVRVPPLANESHTNDNAFGVAIQVVDPRNRVLYVENVPRWESKYLTRVLRANRNLTPLCFLRGPGNRFLTFGEREDMTLELSDEQLARFKIVILGDLEAEALAAPRARTLLKFVENGGSLVLLGGPAAWGPNGYAATELRQLLPVQRDAVRPPEQGTFAVRLTAEGMVHPVLAAATGTWDRLPPVLSVFGGATLATGASALLAAEAAGQTAPLLVVQRYGEGKVAAVLTDSLWRWQLDPGPGRPYAVLWNQLLHWLSPYESEVAPYEIELTTASEQAFLGEALALEARISGAGGAAPEPTATVCEIETPDGRRLPLEMPRQTVQTATGQRLPTYRTEFTPDMPGLHRAVARAQFAGTNVESGVCSFFVKPYSPELEPRPANTALLQALCESSGGRFCAPEELEAALLALPVPTVQEARVLFRTLWNTTAVLACLIGLLVVEWTLRKSRNLP